MNVGRYPWSRTALIVATVVTVVAVGVVGRTVDTSMLRVAIGNAIDDPLRLTLAIVAFALAFVARAMAWRLVVPGLAFGQALSAIHLTLAANHVLPLRLGEPLRVLSVTRRANVPLEVATASTLTLRTADVLTVVALGAVTAPTTFAGLVGPLGWALFGVVVIVALVGVKWLAVLSSRPGAGRGQIRLPGLATIGLSLSAWVAESVVVWQTARWAGLELAWPDAMLVTAVAVAAQVVAVTPGGFGTYEAAAVAAYVALGHDAAPALVAAITAHGLKTFYSVGAGLVGLVLPAPGLLGRFRLRRPAVRTSVPPVGPGTAPPVGPPVGSSADVQPNDPVVLFMPAHNEEATVAECVRRAPRQVLGHPVRVLVVDDGSVDRTAVLARRAGAEVITLGRNRGLGAAVRAGLHEAVAHHAAVVAFCDADGEYPPEELANLVEPILRGEVDYVTGSRFRGRIEHMRPHRRAGNVVLTWFLSIVARRRLTDGQTGYRALSRSAATAAEVIDDYNYAQILTLDLLAKGYRLVEVPISYRFRSEGESFVTLGRYLRHVVPAVYRELNTA